MIWHNHCFAQMRLWVETASHVSDVAQGPLVYFFMTKEFCKKKNVEETYLLFKLASQAITRSSFVNPG